VAEAAAAAAATAAAAGAAHTRAAAEAVTVGASNVSGTARASETASGRPPPPPPASAVSLAREIRALETKLAPKKVELAKLANKPEEDHRGCFAAFQPLQWPLARTNIGNAAPLHEALNSARQLQILCIGGS
jgi:hypothetical protein